jgi:hypothetical protein
MLIAKLILLSPVPVCLLLLHAAVLPACLNTKLLLLVVAMLLCCDVNCDLFAVTILSC